MERLVERFHCVRCGIVMHNQPESLVRGHHLIHTKNVPGTYTKERIEKRDQLRKERQVRVEKRKQKRLKIKTSRFSLINRIKELERSLRKANVKVKEMKIQPEWYQQETFHTSKAWRDIRYKALKRDGGVCALCGLSKKDKVKIHVDHIKPRSKYPELALDLNNLQVLCEGCNMGKSNKDETDWRNNGCNKTVPS